MTEAALKTEWFESVDRLDRDLVRAIKSEKLKLTRQDVRYIVDTRNQVQEFRIQAGGQERAAGETEEPNHMVGYLWAQFGTLEGQVKRAMDAWTPTSTVSRWAKGIHGRGAILAAGLEAHIDIERAPTVGHIWRIAGLDPSVEWLGKVKAERLTLDLTGGKRKLENPTTIVLAAAQSTHLKPPGKADSELGAAKRDQFRRHMTGPGMVWQIKELFMVVIGCHISAGLGGLGRCQVSQGRARLSKSRQGTIHGRERLPGLRPGVAWLGRAGPGMAGPSRAEFGQSRQGTVC